VTSAQNRPALLLLLVGAALAGLGLLLPDERIRVLFVVLAVPMVVGGAVTIAWSNAQREIERLRGDEPGR
jgi:hypothetical protein